jgi:hypothetical protein
MSRNDSELENVYFSAGGKDYKMKCKFVQRQFTFWHRIKAKSKLKKKKKKWGMTFYRGCKADKIEASMSGTIYRNDPSHVCRWDVPYNPTASDIESNKAKAKAVEHVGGKYRSRMNSIQSFHQVTIGGYTTPPHILYLGDDDDPSN